MRMVNDVEDQGNLYSITAKYELYLHRLLQYNEAIGYVTLVDIIRDTTLMPYL